jgi:hypothetical protein
MSEPKGGKYHVKVEGDVEIIGLDAVGVRRETTCQVFGTPLDHVKVTVKPIVEQKRKARSQ